MSVSMMSKIQKTNSPENQRPRRVMLYGTHGIGKSTFASCAPKPIFIRTEDGLQDIDAESFPLATCYADVMESIYELRNAEHDYKTCVIDSADWLEQMIQRYVFEAAGKDCITDVGGGFGKGEDKAATIYKYVLGELSALNVERKMTVILLAHCKIEKIEPPNVAAYSRYSPKMDKRICDVAQEWCDEVLFANYKVYVTKEDSGFGRERGIGIGKGERSIFATEKPAHLAKNRLGMPDEIPLAFASYWEFASKPQLQNETASK